MNEQSKEDRDYDTERDLELDIQAEAYKELLNDWPSQEEVDV